MKLPYDLTDKDSIIEFAKLLIGKSVNQEYKKEIQNLKINSKDKGRLGKVIESLYFKYKNNSDAAADFKEAGLELKSSGLKKLTKNKGFRAKERLVLNIINFEKILDENFENLFLKGKNSHLLLVFYLYLKGINILDSEIEIVGDWNYSEEDIEIIRKDFDFIVNKIADGKAHELSEGDTFYLGASTKGSKGGNPRRQPNNKIFAKQRAFSLKPGYVNHIIASIVGESTEVYGKLIPSKNVAKKQTIEEIVILKFKPYYGKTIEQLVEIFQLELINKKSKQYFSVVSKAILNKILEVPQNKNAANYLEEFDKAEIQIKTVRLKENNLPKEDISFPNFKYEEIVDEIWENSEFKEIIEHKFLFIFFQFENGKLVLRKVKFWNMPYSDILEAEKVWNKTKEVISNGNIVEGFKTDKNGKISRVTNFPGKKFNKVSHVRPHTTDASHTFPLPVHDKFTKKNEYTKHCFWLNNSYIRDEIYLK